MDFIVYLLFFCMGTVFGSFFSLAIYRIPLGQDITHSRSYCPKCQHKLSFLDMIPILSYLFLGGKCRYCKERIRPRYILLEILSGVTFLLFPLSIKFSLLTMTTSEIIYIVIGLLYISTLFIIGGIDKEKIKVEKPVLLFGFICVTLYIIYLYIVEKNTNMYRYVIYFSLVCILSFISIIYLRKKSKNSYPIDILLLLFLMVIYTYEVVGIYTVINTLLAIAIHSLLENKKIKKSKYIKISKKENSKIPIAFYMCATNIITLILTNLYIFYR